VVRVLGDVRVVAGTTDIIMEIGESNVMVVMGMIMVITNKTSYMAYIGLGSNVVKNTAMI
jgi:hypothetical protein